MNESIILILTLIGTASMLCQWLAWWVKVPAILFLLAMGVMLGPVFEVLRPDEIFGELLFPLVSLSVAVILFEGSLTLNFKEIRNTKKVVRQLVSLGAIVTWGVVAVATRYILGLTWQMSLLFGAIVVVSGPTVIMPLLRTVRPTAQVSNILRWEGIVIDPIGALFAVVVFEFIITQNQDVGLGSSLILFFRIILVGLASGALAGIALGAILRNHWLPEYLHNLATLSLVFAVFTLSNSMAHESGLLAVTVMGMWLANMQGIRIQEILNFKENLTIVLISGLFIILAARLNLSEILSLGWSALIILCVIQFIARPLAVFASTIGSSLTLQERLLLSWISPRGIVAAAVSALFSFQLKSAGLEDADKLVPLTFFVIIGTVVLQSMTSRIIAGWLGLTEPEPKGYLIVGANVVARKIAQTLKELGYRVLLTDSSWENISAARMAGLETFFGNPISEYADNKLDLVGIGRVFSLSPQRDLNTAASMRFRMEFGQQNIYTLLTSAETKVSDKHKAADEHRGYTLFSNQVNYGKLASLISKKAEIRKTKITESFTYEAYLEVNSNVIPLFAISPKGTLHVFVVDAPLQPLNGWTVISLFPEQQPIAEVAVEEVGDASSEAPGSLGSIQDLPSS